MRFVLVSSIWVRRQINPTPSCL